MLGRSDATLNRHGVRIGTAEIYRSLAGASGGRGLADREPRSAGRKLLHAAVRQARATACELDDELERAIRDQLRTEYSPRHVPDRIIQVDAIPYTLTGKKLEVPVRRILMRASAPEKAANRAAMAESGGARLLLSSTRAQQDYAGGDATLFRLVGMKTLPDPQRKRVASSLEVGLPAASLWVDSRFIEGRACRHAGAECCRHPSAWSNARERRRRHRCTTEPVRPRRPRFETQQASTADRRRVGRIEVEGPDRGHRSCDRARKSPRSPMPMPRT